jgi:hypothetical protein
VRECHDGWPFLNIYQQLLAAGYTDRVFAIRPVLLALILLTRGAMGQYTIATVAGGALPTTPVAAVQATLPAASGLAVDGAGNVYFSLASQNAVFKIDRSGTLTRVAGAAEITGVSRAMAAATGTELDAPQGLAVDAAGNLYIAETGANRVRKVSTNGAISTVAGGMGAGYSGDDSPALAAQLNGPTGLALDAGGRLYIADAGNYRIRVVSPAGIITTVAGTGTAGQSTSGAATASNLGFVDSIATDSQGNLYIADRMWGAVLRVTQGGALATFAGSGYSFGYSGDNGPATAALLNSPSGVAADSAGNLYIADSGNNVIRKVAANGTITTIAGNGKPALAVWGIAVDGHRCPVPVRRRQPDPANCRGRDHRDHCRRRTGCRQRSRDQDYARIPARRRGRFHGEPVPGRCGQQRRAEASFGWNAHHGRR